MSSNNGLAIPGASSDSEEKSHIRQNVVPSIGSRFYAKDKKQNTQPPPQEYHERSAKIGTVGKRKRHGDIDSEAGSSLAAVEALLDDSHLEENERRVKCARLRRLPISNTIRKKRPSNVPRHSDNHQQPATTPARVLHHHQHPRPPPQQLRPLRRQLAYQRINPAGRSDSDFGNRAARPLRRDEDLVVMSATGVPEVQKMHHNAKWRAARKNRPFFTHRLS